MRKEIPKASRIGCRVEFLANLRRFEAKNNSPLVRRIGRKDKVTSSITRCLQEHSKHDYALSCRLYGVGNGCRNTASWDSSRSLQPCLVSKLAYYILGK